MDNDILTLGQVRRMVVWRLPIEGTRRPMIQINTADQVSIAGAEVIGGSEDGLIVWPVVFATGLNAMVVVALSTEALEALVGKGQELLEAIRRKEEGDHGEEADEFT